MGGEARKQFENDSIVIFTICFILLCIMQSVAAIESIIARPNIAAENGENGASQNLISSISSELTPPPSPEFLSPSAGQQTKVLIQPFNSENQMSSEEGVDGHDDINIVLTSVHSSNDINVGNPGNENDVDELDDFDSEENSLQMLDLNNLSSDDEHLISKEGSKRIGRDQNDVTYRKWRYKITDDRNKKRLRPPLSNRENINLVDNINYAGNYLNPSNQNEIRNYRPNNDLIRSNSISNDPLAEHPDRRHHSRTRDRLRHHRNRSDRRKLTLAERRRISWRRKQQQIITSGVPGHHGHSRDGVLVNHRRVSVTTRTETIHSKIIPGTVSGGSTASINSYTNLNYPGSGSRESGHLSGSVANVVTTPSSVSVNAAGTGLPAWVGGSRTSNSSHTTTVTKEYYGYYRNWLRLLLSKKPNISITS